MEKLFKRKVVFILLSLAIALSTAFCLFGVHTAKAEEKQNGTVAISHVIPESNMEVYDLSSPIDAYYWQGGIAIVQSGSLVICTNDVYHQPIALTSPKQVKRLDNNTLIVSRNGALCSIDLNNPDATPVELKTVSNTTVGGNDFDCNEDYIESEYANDINIYTIRSDGIL